MKVDFTRYKPDGYKFTPTKEDPYLGQCKNYGRKITDLSMPLGNAYEATLAIFKSERAAGRAFYSFEKKEVKPGYGAFFKGGSFGHYAVVSLVQGNQNKLSESNWIRPLTVDHDRYISMNDSSLVGYFMTNPLPEYIVEDFQETIHWISQNDAFAGSQLVKRIYFTTARDMTGVILAYRRDVNVINPVVSDVSLFTVSKSPVNSLGDDLYYVDFDITPTLGLKQGSYREDFGLAYEETLQWIEDTRFNCWFSYDVH